MASMIVAVAFLLAAVQAKISPEQLINSLELSPEMLQAAFDGLDINTDGKITQKDLDIHFYHAEAEFAKSKFIKLTNKDANKDIDKKEMDDFLKTRPVTNAVWECVYIHSESLRSYCFADQILTYVYLVLDNDNISEFFNKIEDQADKDKVIKLDEVKKLVSYDPKFTEKEALNFMKELGGADDSITYDEFRYYVSQEDLLDDFRVCRTKLEGCVATYKMECLIKALLDHTMNELTELDIAATFIAFGGDDDSDIDMDDLAKVPNLCAEAAKRFITLMDRSQVTEKKENKVSYGEFRTYVRTHTVKVHLERDCARKFDDQADEVACFVTEVIKRVTENHTPIWLRLPDLDMLFLFEDLDTSDDGKISVSKDLVGGKKWDQAVADKLVQEMDGPDTDRDVTLEEFMEYVDWPNIVFGIGDCLGTEKGERGQKRVDCYVDELKTNIQDMMTKEQVLKFYVFYDKDKSGKITKAEIAAVGVIGKKVENFLDEVGMGDDEITESEFFWYVRQQELSNLLKAKSAEQDWHIILVNYMENIMTEFDIQELFKELDTDHDFEIDCAVFGAQATAITHVLEQMDLGDPDNTVNFVEFWVFLNNPIGAKRKKQLEAKCTEKHEDQKDEIKCYKDNIKGVK